MIETSDTVLIIEISNGNYTFQLCDKLEREEEILHSVITICNADFYYVLLVSVTREYESSSD